MSNQPAPPPTQIGTAIAVVDSTALALLDATHMLPGTTVYNLALATQWQLTVSTASLGPTVVAVAGVAGYRWIEQDAAGGFVTLAELASTTVTSGATLIGVNANGGQFSQADLQHVLQTDVVSKVQLAATDGTGGGSIVGIQDTGNYYTTNNVEAALAQLGPLVAGGFQTIANPSAFTLANAHVLEADLTATSTDVVEDVLIEKRSTSGTAAVGMGARNTVQMPDTSGAARAVWTEEVTWTGVGSGVGSNTSAKSTFLAGSGVGTGLDERMRLTGGGFGQAQFATGNTGSQKPGISFLADGRFGMAIDDNNNLALCSNAGGVVLALSGTQLGVFTKANTPAAPGSVGAAATNSVAPTGSANVYPDFTNGVTYATDYASLHATVSQMAAKLTAIEASLRAMGLIVT